jgi:hypothetical protein
VSYRIKTRSQEKNAVMKPLLLGMWLADNANARKCFSGNIFIHIPRPSDRICIEYVFISLS